MPNYENVDNLFPQIFLGNNLNEPGEIEVAASGKVAVGDIVYKDGSVWKPFASSVTGDVVLGVMNIAVENDGSATATVVCSPVISGIINRKKITVGGVAATEAQVDALRKYGFVPQNVNELDTLDNS